MFHICSFCGMERLDPTLIAEAILQAPGWAHFGLSADTTYLREEAAAELARAIVAYPDAPTGEPARDQMGLAL
jgi:hypothetical protein